MNCPSCARSNRAGARFCGGCGASLAPRCPACGATNEPNTRFCDACGAALAPEPAAEAVARKVVTIVFADLIGSTALHERLDPESVSRVMESYHATVRTPVEAHGGSVVQLLGDGVMCAFGVPQVAEDDALRAVRAAVAVQHAFRAFVAEHPELAGKVGLRVAVNTGEVVVSDDYAAGIGDPLNVAARLQQEARDGDVLLGESTQRHVREQVTLAQVGSFALKGRAEPVAAYRVVSLERPPGAAAIPFVGREEELRRLQAVYDAAVSAPAARLAVLLGSPGLGKSRLVAELAQRLEGRVALLSARCESARGATFAPLAAALRDFLGERGDASAQVEALLPADEPERAQIVQGIAALLAGQPASPQETFFVVRRFLAALAKARPVLLLIDDLHWAEPLLLDLVEHLVQWGGGVRLLVLAAARPELRALRSSLATSGPLASDVVTLAGLDAVAATRLAARVIGAEALPAAIAGRVLAASEGNPLFLAELVRMLVDDGVLRRQGEQWVADEAIADFAMPPSIQALLAARIERLAPEERTVLERAAVVGRHFSRSALAALLPREITDLDARLEALRRSELIEPDTGWLLGEPALRFHHALIRDAAYRRVLKNTRAELHARIAGWIEERAGQAVEYDETIGWHWEQAHQNLRELGPLDERAREFGTRAARYLGAAGQRALARDDLPLAAGLLGRALERLEPESPARTELVLDRCEALLATGEVSAATPAVAELGRLASGSERLRAWHTCLAGQLAALTDPDALRATAEAAAAAAETLAAAGDAVGEAKAHSVHAGALARLGAIGACEAALDRALAAARRANDRRRANAVLAGAPLAALFGPSPVTRASGRCLDVVRVLRITQGAPAVEAVALRCQAVLEALRGRLDAARRMVAASRRLVEELGITQQLLESDVFAGQIEWLAGDAVAAERWLRDAYTGLRQRGLRIDAARAAAQLGRILLAQGRAREAEELSHESEALAGDDLQAAIAWRGVRAEALAQRGEHGAAVELARSAVEIAAATDALLHHADARRALAAVLAAAGRSAEAAQEDARAVELWETKGATLLADRARRETGHAVGAERPSLPRSEPASIPRRRVRPNAATEHVARFDAAIAARDAHTIRELVADPALTTHHPTGAEYGRDEVLRGLLIWIEMPAASYRHEPLATLGDSLALCRTSSSAGGASIGDLDLGAVDRENVGLIETDLQGRRRRAELFAPERLGAAIARLYERHAELLPEGPEQERAETTARAVAAWLQVLSSPDRYDGHIADRLEFTDHRRGGIGSVSGAEVFLSGYRSLHELARDLSFAIHDVLGLRPDAFLLRTTTTGIDRASGGAFERPLLLIGGFGPDGLVSRVEWFDPERPAEALARFDELGAPQLPAVRRRVRPNAATANVARIEAAVAAREVDQLAALHEPGFESLHHPTETMFDREATVTTLRWAIRSGASFRLDPLATLGGALALFHQRVSSPASGNPRFEVGAYEVDLFVIHEAEEAGRARRTEAFASDRLGAAITRLYERHAELLPEGAEQERAAATARSVAALLAQPDLERWASVFAPDIEFVDSRNVGFGSIRGAEAVVSAIRALFELMSDFSNRIEDVLGAAADALVVRWINTGSARDGGGNFERDLCHVWRFGTDGRLTRWQQFDAARENEALARLDAPAVPAGAPRIENAATRLGERVHAAWVARDWEAFVAHYPPGYRIVDRQRRVQLESDRDSWLASYRRIFDMSSSRLVQRDVATRGERLVLAAVGWQGMDDSVGPSELDWLLVIEVDERGELATQVVFDPDALEAAYAELDARYAAGEGAGDAAWQDVAAFSGAFNRRDFEGLARRLGAGFVLHDHRALGWGAVDATRYVELLRSLTELAPDARYRLDHFVAGGRGCLTVGSAIGTRDGGAFEMTRITVVELDATGRRRRMDQYDDADQLDAARARFAELTSRPAAARIENAATRAAHRLHQASRARDIGRLEAELALEYRHVDRRQIVGGDADRSSYVESLRPILAMAARLDVTTHVLATRGDRLALERTRITLGQLEAGPSEIEFLQIFEVDAPGRIAAGLVFDHPDALDAALAELDARYAAGEGAAHPRVLSAQRRFSDAFAARDWAAVATQYADDIVVYDHRLLGWEPIRNSTAYVDSLRTLVELSPDVEIQSDHVSISERGLLWIARWVGTREGGPFEAPWITVSEHDAEGRVQRFDTYDFDQLDLARARFAELSAPPAQAPRFENAATRWMGRYQAEKNVGDAARLAALHAPGFTMDDRRRHVQLVLDREQALLLPAGSYAWRYTWEPVATRGDRLALVRGRNAISTDLVGPSEIDWLSIVEVNEAGGRTLGILFDPDDLDAAWAELDARFGAGEGAACSEEWREVQALARAFNARDFDAVAEPLAPGFELHDHRTLGWGLVGGSGYVELLRSLVELSPDVRYRIFHFLGGKQRSLAIGGMSGTRDGGAFEMTRVVIRELDASGRLVRTDHYDLDQLDQARARFEALRPDPLRIPPNAAAWASARLAEIFWTGESEGYEAGVAPSFEFDDRRRGIRNSGDRETFLASGRLIHSAGSRPIRTVLATAGERLVLEHALWRNERLEAEVETLQVIEVDAEGRLVASIVFDPDDRRAASDELFVRFHRGEGARAGSERFIEFVRASNAHDAVRARATLPDDFVFHDHRRTGLGRLGNADDYVASLAVLWEQSGDATIDTLYYLAFAEHAALSVGRIFGTLASGGEFESLSVRLGLFRSGQFAGAEVYELEDLDRARARFDELRPDPLRIPPNAASRSSVRLHESLMAGDLEAFAAAIAASFEFDDRRRGIRNSGDRETFLASAGLIHSAGSRPSRTVLATAGERLVLERALWRNERLETEVETLEVLEIDGEGRLVAAVVFDPEDRRAASLEMLERTAGQGAAGLPAVAFEGLRAMNDHDLDRLSALMPTHFFVDDHRRTGLGRIEGAERFLTSLAPLFEQAPDLTFETLHTVAAENHGELAMVRMFGTLAASGGEVESFYARLLWVQGDQIVGMELFEPHDLERARARFEALRPDPLHIPPNAATRAFDRIGALRLAGDWSALRALTTPDFRYEDRQRHSLVSGDVELYLRNLQVVSAYPNLKPTRKVLATVGERITIGLLAYTGGSEGSPFEGEFLLLNEVDAAGRLRAVIHFDADDRPAAFEEAQARFVAGEAGGNAGQAAIVAFGRSLVRHAWDEVRDCLARDAVMKDHRTLGFGELDGAAYVDSLRVFSELAPDMRLEAFRILTWNARGRVSLVRVHGTREGGAFENLLVSVALTPADRIQRFELFDVTDAERAVVRFEALCAELT